MARLFIAIFCIREDVTDIGVEQLSVLLLGLLLLELQVQQVGEEAELTKELLGLGGKVAGVDGGYGGLHQASRGSWQQDGEVSFSISRISAEQCSKLRTDRSEDQGVSCHHTMVSGYQPCICEALLVSKSGKPGEQGAPPVLNCSTNSYSRGAPTTHYYPLVAVSDLAP